MRRPLKTAEGHHMAAFMRMQFPNTTGSRKIEKPEQHSRHGSASDDLSEQIAPKEERSVLRYVSDD